ncbi:hypothetical protein [Flavobacterium sp. XS2P14]|uniref:hypothetical protein n=1 Tax=Flavobacterium sp. XS2P14 TaxID=3401735 RepID=UPI003AACF329
MIDNVKIFVTGRHRLENHIKNNKLMDFTSKVNMLTGEVMEYPKKGMDLNLDVSITSQSAIILGSFHKYKNLLEDNVNQNHDDFNYCQIQEIISGLIKKYNIEKDTKINNLEFGFNLVVSKDPKIILDNNVLMNSYKAPNKNLKFSGSGDYKEFQLTDYRIKLYNKSKQYRLKSNILRVELKIIQTRLLQKLRIHCLEDLLNVEALTRLFHLFMDKFEGLNIIDNFDPETIPEKDYNKLIKYTNPNYWISIKEKKSNKVIARLKTDFVTLLNKYKLLETKNEIREKLNLKFVELLESDCYRNVA